MKIVVRAGGVGSRLWPVSRQSQPKQFHAFTGPKTMLAEAIDRIRPIADLADVYVSTNVNARDVVYEQYSDIPKENVIVEPARKDTAAAIGLESIIIHAADPEAVVASLGSDHSVRRPEEFQRMLLLAEEFVSRHPEYIIPIGIKPTRPDDGYGYIQYSEVLDTLEGKNLWKVERFTEKPSVETAEHFLQQGNFLWNANMFVWKVSTILDLYKKHLPDMYEQLMTIQEALGTPEQEEVIARVYPRMEKIAVDYGIIEKAEHIAAMSADIGWNDIGDWSRLKDELSDSEKESVVLGDAEYIEMNTVNSLVYEGDSAKKMVVTVGVKNLVVVDTEDVLLICHKDQSGKVKDIVQRLKDRNKDELL